jgi:hypothetical protein
VLSPRAAITKRVSSPMSRLPFSTALQPNRYSEDGRCRHQLMPPGSRRTPPSLRPLHDEGEAIHRRRSWLLRPRLRT